MTSDRVAWSVTAHRNPAPRAAQNRKTLMVKNVTAGPVIQDYAPVEKANPYTEHVVALDLAGPGKSLNVSCTSQNAARTMREIARAANSIDRSARLRAVITDAGSFPNIASASVHAVDSLALVVTLGARQHRSGRPRKTAE